MGTGGTADGISAIATRYAADDVQIRAIRWERGVSGGSRAIFFTVERQNASLSPGPQRARHEDKSARAKRERAEMELSGQSMRELQWCFAKGINPPLA